MELQAGDSRSSFVKRGTIESAIAFNRLQGSARAGEFDYFGGNPARRDIIKRARP